MYYYVYRISNVVENKHYYGKRTSKIEPKLDLGIKYFSSSTDKKFIDDQKINPQNYEYIIVAYCSTAKEALSLEVYLHEYYNVGVNPRFYNKAKQTDAKFSTDGVKLSEERKEHLRKINTGKKLSKETKRKVALAGVGRKQTDRCKAILLSVHTGSKRSEETKTKMSLAKKNKKLSEDHKNKIKLAAAKRVNHPAAKLINVYNYTTNELLAENVVASVWCTENKYNPHLLRATIKRDLDKPHYASKKQKEKYNPHHYKNMYAVEID